MDKNPAGNGFKDYDGCSPLALVTYNSIFFVVYETSTFVGYNSDFHDDIPFLKDTIGS